MNILNRWKSILIWAGLPVGVGLFLALIAHLFLPIEFPFLTSADLKITGIVFGMSIRNSRWVAFILGFLIALIVLFIRHWDRMRIAQSQTLYADYLQDERKNRRDFMRRLDHEIKNPLTGLRAALVNLKEEQTDEQRQRAVGNANRAVERLIRLLTDLRKLSDLEERAIERISVDVPDLLDDVVTAARVNPVHEGREINLLIPKVPSPFPSITGDRDLLLLAAYNLVENALKFTSEDESVEVRAMEDGRAIVIEVADTGMGIPPDDLANIFEELYRGSNARGTEGSGLGLALVNRIASLHGGGVGVRSSQEDPRGTVFTLRLPRR
ncbi:MAG TPA: HAMP domain-containing sensor histidine kinase [Anaerolineales bacterium]|nr:HAMP domain-containing sensor histidine kinase [Anaerolineales bacterium]